MTDTLPGPGAVMKASVKIFVQDIGRTEMWALPRHSTFIVVKCWHWMDESCLITMRGIDQQGRTFECEIHEEFVPFAWEELG